MVWCDARVMSWRRGVNLVEYSSERDYILVMLTLIGVVVFFFFQAEDGIRDYKVTGVQTCALPIFAKRCIGIVDLDRRHSQLAGRLQVAPDVVQERHARRRHVELTAHELVDPREIGRASCRERV